jgi:hypothetical protein
MEGEAFCGDAECGLKARSADPAPIENVGCDAYDAKRTLVVRALQRPAAVLCPTGAG